MKILIVTDAWHPQINGVVRTLSITAEELQRRGHEVVILGPDQFRTYPLPTYKEIRVAWWAGGELLNQIDEHQPDAIHIATEGPIGIAARNYCVRRGLHFTTSYHTKFPEYIAKRFPIPIGWIYKFLRWFHEPSSAVMVATPTVQAELERHGFKRLVRWTRGVHTDLFYPRPELPPLPYPKPIQLYVGRVAVEKNLPAFLNTKQPGTKIVVGSGPQLKQFEKNYPTVVFTGPKQGEELAKLYASADIFVFPSLTDTFGLVLLEALASGLPVAAYPVAGPLDVINDPTVGCLDRDLNQAIATALSLDGNTCRAFALRYSWAAATQQFLDNLYVLQPDEFGQPSTSSTGIFG